MTGEVDAGASGGGASGGNTGGATGGTGATTQGNPASTGTTTGGTQTTTTTATTGAQTDPKQVTPTASTEVKPFTPPEAYKDKPWAAKIKTDEDLWKTLDNAQTLIGKKGVTMPDFEKATPEEVESFYATLRPADKAAYKFAEGADEQATGAVAELLYKNGITAHQGNAIIEAYGAMERQALQEVTSAEGFNAVMQETFGDKYKETVAQVTLATAPHLSEADKAIMNNLPNKFLAPVMKAINGIMQKYGVTENAGAHDGNRGNPSAGGDIDAQISALTKQLTEITAKPHTADDKQKLIDQRHALFQKKAATRK